VSSIKIPLYNIPDVDETFSTTVILYLMGIISVVFKKKGIHYEAAGRDIVFTSICTSIADTGKFWYDTGIKLVIA
jgi:hypothetical protein